MNVIKLLVCPVCKNKLFFNKKILKCVYCHQNYYISGSCVNLMSDSETNDVRLSIDKWDDLYKSQIVNKSYLKDYLYYKKTYLKDTLNQLREAKKINSNTVYLEIGCGAFYLGQTIAKYTKMVIGIDYCPSALKIAKIMLEEKGIENYLLIQANILDMPIRDNVIDLIYGGGVIEHFNDTQKCVNELYRVLKKGGVAFNTVPYLNIGALTYRQIWGNIPNLPVLKQIAEFIHIKLLKGKHMIFGYEMSFLGSTLKGVYEKAGFEKVYIDKFKVKLAFDFIPTKFLKKLCIKIANSNRLFWPMIKVVGRK